MGGTVTLEIDLHANGGSDICTMPLGVENRPEKKLPGCRK